MFSHVMLGSNDLDRSRTFYDALFVALGGRAVGPDEERLIYRHKGSTLMIGKPIDGNPASPGNGATVAFAVDSPEQADAWHKAGVENGGTSIEDPPGIRERLLPIRIYLAYLRDPDGNKLCALHRMG